MAIIELSNVTMTYGRGAKRRPALRNVSLAVPEGGFSVLLGPSGAGKSTLLRLVLAIDGKGAFRRFKDVLLSYPVERDRWFQYRANLLHIYINGWLTAHDFELGEEPPWGDPDQPPEPDIPLEKPTGTRGEGPTEALRRQARELIDSMPALELPSLIAYLKFLREKSPTGPVPEGDEARPVE